MGCWGRAFVVTITIALTVMLGLSNVFLPAARGQDRPAGFRTHRSFLWLHRAPPLDDRLLVALEKLGVSGTNSAGTADASLLSRRRTPFYVDHVAGKGRLALRPKVFESARTTWRETRTDNLLRRPHCLTDPATTRATTRRISEVLDAVLPHRPLALTLDDEISLTRNGSPFDFCRSPTCLAAFRTFLRERYGSLVALNAAWSRTFDSWNDVVPLTTDTVRRRELIRPVSQRDFTDWSDHRDFMDRVFTRAVHDAAEQVRRRATDVPVGFTGGGAPSAFSGLAWSRMLEHVDVVEPYDIGGSRGLVGSFARPNTVILRTVFRDELDARFNRHELFDYALRGDDGVIIWSAGDYFVDRRADRPTPWAEALREPLQNLAGEAFTKLHNATPVAARIAVVESMAANRMHWMNDSADDGPNWINRLSSWEETHSSQNRHREAWQKLLEDIGVAFAYVDADCLTTTDLTPYRVLVLPRTIALDDDQAEAVRRFGRHGVVVADSETGWVDGRLRARKRGALDDDFGIRRGGRRVLRRDNRFVGKIDAREPDLRLAETTVSIVEKDVRQGTTALAKLGGVPIGIRRASGRSDADGAFVYLNLLFVDYLEQRLAGHGARLREIVADVLRDAGVMPMVTVEPLKLSTATTVPMRIDRRRRDGREYIGVIANFATSTWPTARERLLANDPAHRRDVTVRFSRPRRVRQLWPPVAKEAAENSSKKADERPHAVSYVTVKTTLFDPILFEVIDD